MFHQATNFVLNGATFTNHTAVTGSLSAFERLQQATAPGAFHNSGERFDPPKCHPRTRRAVIERIMNWILGKESTESLIMWLNGPAGAGKSAIAQTIAELCHDAGILLASFFFSRSDPHRNHAKSLFPTLAYQIACTFPDARSQVEKAIERDPLIFTRSLEAQMVALIVEPLQFLVASGRFEDSTTSPRLVIIDGLDEVKDPRMQTKILDVISNGLRQHHIPLIFLVASRPEQQILFAFGSQSLARLTDCLCLDDTFHPDDDIRLFLDDSLSEIKETHPRKHLIPSSWPSSDTVDMLVRKASGQFIYASTVIKFVESIRHRPTERLEIVLGLRPPQRDLPFAELDALYIHILSSLEDAERTLLIIGTLLVVAQAQGASGFSHYQFTTSGIESFLGMDAGDAEFLLADVSSLISLGEDVHRRRIRILHASFGDFLFDPSRSGQFAIDRKTMHTIVACHGFRYMRQISHAPLDEDSMHQYAHILYTVADHVAMGCVTAELVAHLRELSVEHLLGYLSSYMGLSLSWGVMCSSFWFSFVPNLISTMKPMVLDESEYHMLRSRNFDQIVKKELDVYYAVQPSLSFLLCLICVALGYWKRLWAPYITMPRLTDWNTDYHRMHVEQQLGRLDLFHLGRFRQAEDIFREFLQDASRSGEYTVNAETYANASVSCLKYLSHYHLAMPINLLLHTRRNFAMRRNSPWRWRHLMKYLNGLRIRDLRPPPAIRQKCFPKLYWRWKQHQTYSDATFIALDSLPELLVQSAKSDELIALASAEKPFSQRALQFPNDLKKCKAAINAYLARVVEEAANGTDEDVQMTGGI